MCVHVSSVVLRACKPNAAALSLPMLCVLCQLGGQNLDTTRILSEEGCSHGIMADPFSSMHSRLIAVQR